MLQLKNKICSFHSKIIELVPVGTNMHVTYHADVYHFG